MPKQPAVKKPQKPQKNILTHEDRAERRKKIALYFKQKKGNDVYLAATLFGVTVETVRSACKEHGVDPPIRSSEQYQLPNESTFRIIGLLATTKKSLSQIAQEVGVSTGRVFNILGRCKAGGVPVNGR